MSLVCLGRIVLRSSRTSRSERPFVFFIFFCAAKLRAHIGPEMWAEGKLILGKVIRRMLDWEFEI